MTTLTKHNPYNWLKKLNQTILLAKGKKDGEQISLEDACLAAGKIISQTIESDASIWWVGNGGSAAICSHLSQDTLNKLDARSFCPADPSLMTCMANDFGYENVYLKPLEKLAKSKDLLIAISSSGNSENIIRCAKMALKRDMDLITLSGFEENNRLWNIKSDLSFFVPTDLYGIAELSHEAILHGIVESLWLEKQDALVTALPKKQVLYN